MHFEYATELAQAKGGTPLPDSRPLENGIHYDLRLEFADASSAMQFMAQVGDRVEIAVMYGPTDKVLVQVVCSQQIGDKEGK
jgi:hypothetical protein